MKKNLLIVLGLVYFCTLQTMDRRETDPNDPEFKERQQKLLAEASLATPFNPQNPEAREQLIQRLRLSLELKNRPAGIQHGSIHSPSTDVALRAAQGKKTPTSSAYIASRSDSNTVLLSLVSRRSNTLRDEPLRSQSPAVPDTAISSSSGTENPTTVMPTLVFSDHPGNFLGLSDDDDIVVATDATIRTIGFEGVLDQLEDEELKRRFKEEVNQSPRLTKSASDSPGRKSGVLTPKRAQSPRPNQTAVLLARSEGNTGSQPNLQTLSAEQSAAGAAATARSTHATTVSSSARERSSSPLVRGLKALRGDKKDTSSHSPLSRRSDD